MDVEDDLVLPGDVVSRGGSYICVNCLVTVELEPDEPIPRCTCCGVEARYLELIGSGVLEERRGVESHRP